MKTDNQLIEEYGYIVATIVKQYHYSDWQEDLMQEGMIGLIEAGRKYDPACGVTFESYAAWWARKYVKDAVRRYIHMIAIPAHPKKDCSQTEVISYDQPLYEEDGDVVTLQDVLPDDTNLEEWLDRKLITEELMSVLNEREKKIVRNNFGLDSRVWSTEAIAAEMGLNTWTVHKVFERAVKKMQKKGEQMSKNM